MYVTCEESHIGTHQEWRGPHPNVTTDKMSSQKQKPDLNREMSVQNIELKVTKHGSVSKYTTILRRVDDKVRIKTTS